MGWLNKILFMYKKLFVQKNSTFFMLFFFFINKSLGWGKSLFKSRVMAYFWAHWVLTEILTNHLVTEKSRDQIQVMTIYKLKTDQVSQPRYLFLCR